MTQVHPIARAGPNFHACISNGKFQGIIIVIDDSIISVYIQQMWQKIKLNNIEENLLKTTLNLLKMLTSRIFTSIHFKESLMTVLRQ